MDQPRHVPSLALVGALARCGGLAGLLLVLSGCSTFTERAAPLRAAFYANNLPAARELAVEAQQKRRQDRHALQLDQAMIELVSGRPQQAEQLLREVRDELDALEDPQVASSTLAYFTDDQRRAYAGEDYEKVLLRAFLALSNLFHDGGDAEAYSLQMIDKQEQIIASGVDPQGDNPKLNYERVALAPYLRGVMREASHHDYDDAQRSFAAVVNWQPEFRPGPWDLARATHGRHSPPGHGVLYVFALTGRGPLKEEVVEEPSSVSLLFAGQLVSQFAQQTVPPNLAPVKVPRVRPRFNGVSAVAVGVDQQPLGATATITDVTRLAMQQSEALFPQVVARAVARRCIKKGTIYGAKEAVGLNKGSLPGLAFDLAGIAWEATEAADTRGWGLLPDKIQVLRAELPRGEHTVTLAPILDGRISAAARVDRSVTIRDGANTYLLVTFPDHELVGEVLVSQ